MLLSSTSYAGVTDNLNGWLVQFLGVGNEEEVPDEYGGSLVERVNFLEKENRELKEMIEAQADASSTSCNLFVYIPNVAVADDVNCSLMTYAEGYKISGDVRLQIWRAADRYYWVGTRYGEGTARFVNSDSVIHYFDEGYGYACIPAFTISAKE